MILIKPDPSGTAFATTGGKHCIGIYIPFEKKGAVLFRNGSFRFKATIL